LVKLLVTTIDTILNIDPWAASPWSPPRSNYSDPEISPKNRSPAQ